MFGWKNSIISKSLSKKTKQSKTTATSNIRYKVNVIKYKRELIENMIYF